MSIPKTRWAELAYCLIAGATLSLALGQDCSWDLRNYHLYNPLNLLQGRFALDFFPADKQTGINPLLDVVYASLSLGALSSYPRTLAALMGCWYGLFVFVSLRITAHLFAPFAAPERRFLIPLSTLIAATGAMTVSQTGTTSNDVATAAMILLGLLCVLPTESVKKRTPLILSGIFLGLAAGAKLTAITYTPALLLALLVVLPWRQALSAGTLFSFGWLAGFLPLFGSWGLVLYQRFANPVFPMFNDLFQSPLAPAVSLRDLRFLPHDLLQGLLYPFAWAWDATRHPVYETNFSDPRLALATIALVATGFWSIKTIIKKSPIEERLTQTQKIAAFFLIFSYLLWLVTSAILRYAVALESLSALVAMALFTHLASHSRFKTRLTLFAPVLLVGILCLTLTRYPDLTRRPFEDKVFRVDLGWTQPNTQFIGVYEPFAYLAAFVPPENHDSFIGLPFISAMEGWPLAETGKARVQNHNGSTIVLFRESRRSFLQLLPSVGLSSQVKNCRTLESNLAPADSPPVLACEAIKLEPSP